MAKITDFIAGREVKQLLIRRGLDPIRRELNLINSDLERHIRSPEMSATAWDAAKIRAREIMANLQRRLDAIQEAATIFFRSAATRGLLAEELKGRIAAFDLEAHLSRVIQSKKYAKNMDTALHEAVEVAIAEVLNGWLEGIRKGDTPSSVKLREAFDLWSDEGREHMEAAKTEARSDAAGLFDHLPFHPYVADWQTLSVGQSRYKVRAPFVKKEAFTDTVDSPDGSGSFLDMFRDFFASVREVFTGESMNYQFYLDQVRGIAWPAKTEAMTHAEAIVERLVEWLREQIQAVRKRQEIVLLAELDERIEQGDSSVEKDVESLREVMRKAQQHFGQFEQAAESPGQKLARIANSLNDELAAAGLLLSSEPHSPKNS